MLCAWLLASIIEFSVSTSAVYTKYSDVFFAAFLAGGLIVTASLGQAHTVRTTLLQVAFLALVYGMVRGLFACIDLWESISECAGMSDTDRSIGRACMSTNSVYAGRTCVFEGDYNPSMYLRCPEFESSKAKAMWIHAGNVISLLVIWLPNVYLAFKFLFITRVYMDLSSSHEELLDELVIRAGTTQFKDSSALSALFSAWHKMRSSV